MRHLQKGRKLHRETGQRSALLKSMAFAFFLHGKIATTEAKAKELRPFIERLLSFGKDASVAKRRLVAARLSPKAVQAVVGTAKKLAGRSGGYTRIIKTGFRKSDGAKTALLELVQ